MGPLCSGEGREEWKEWKKGDRGGMDGEKKRR